MMHFVSNLPVLFETETTPCIVIENDGIYNCLEMITYSI